MDIAVKVYLNEGSDNYFGFHNNFANEPRLRLAASFTVKMLEIDTMPSTHYPRPLLERIYEQLNVGGEMVPAEPWTTRYRAEGNRSLSVGDVVVVDDKAYACEQLGWTDVEDEDILEAVRKFNTEGAYLR